MNNFYLTLKQNFLDRHELLLGFVTGVKRVWTGLGIALDPMIETKKSSGQSMKNWLSYALYKFQVSSVKFDSSTSKIHSKMPHMSTLFDFWVYFGHRRVKFHTANLKLVQGITQSILHGLTWTFFVSTMGSRAIPKPIQTRPTPDTHPNYCSYTWHFPVCF